MEERMATRVVMRYKDAFQTNDLRGPEVLHGQRHRQALPHVQKVVGEQHPWEVLELIKDFVLQLKARCRRPCATLEDGLIHMRENHFYRSKAELYHGMHARTMFPVENRSHWGAAQ